MARLIMVVASVLFYLGQADQKCQGNECPVKVDSLLQVANRQATKDRGVVEDLMIKLENAKVVLTETLERIAKDAEVCTDAAGDDLDAKWVCIQTAINDVVVLIPTSEQVAAVCENVAAEGFETSAEDCQNAADKLSEVETMISDAVTVVDQTVEDAIQIANAAMVVADAVKQIKENAVACVDAAEKIGPKMVCAQTAINALAPFVPSVDEVDAACMKAASYAKDEAAAETKCAKVSEELRRMEALAASGKKFGEAGKKAKAEVDKIKEEANECKALAGDDVALLVMCAQTAAQSAAVLLPPIEQITSGCMELAENSKLLSDGHCQKLTDSLTDMAEAVTAAKNKANEVAGWFGQ